MPSLRCRNIHSRIENRPTCETYATGERHAWLQINGLLNPNKSEVIQLTGTSGRDWVDEVTSSEVSNAVIRPSLIIKSLCVTLTRNVTNVCRRCYCHIRVLRHVRESLSVDVARTVARSIIGSVLVYCYSLYAATTKWNLMKVQRVQNTLACVIVGQVWPFNTSFEGVILLPIENRVTSNLATLTYNMKSAVRGQTVFLRYLLSDYEPVRTLRFSLMLCWLHMLLTLFSLRVVSDILQLLSGIVSQTIFYL